MYFRNYVIYFNHCEFLIVPKKYIKQFTKKKIFFNPSLMGIFWGRFFFEEKGQPQKTVTAKNADLHYYIGSSCKRELKNKGNEDIRNLCIGSIPVKGGQLYPAFHRQRYLLTVALAKTKVYYQVGLAEDGGLISKYI